jgi:hypothetical protein
MSVRLLRALSASLADYLFGKIILLRGYKN